MIQRKHGILGRFTRYGTVGLAVNLGAYVLFLSLLYWGMPPVIGSGVTYVVAVATSYFVNRRWSFGSTVSHSRDMPRYLLAYGVGLAVAMSSMHFLTFLIPPAIAQVLVIGITAMVIFICLEVLRFGREE